MPDTNPEPEEEEEKEPITKHEFYFETALYKVFKKGELEPNWWKGEVDAYNPISHLETTYTIHMDEMSQFAGVYTHFKKISLSCQRRSDQELRFFIYNDGDQIFKCGQYPSLADIQYAEIGKKYDKILSENDLTELKKAIGLAAHGAGIGSYVHLRRIFENLIVESFEANKATIGIEEQVFKTKRMEDKVELLKTFLPSQLVEMKTIYGVLSKGIHELDEEECLKFFPAIKLAITLILEQKVEMNVKKKRDEDAKKMIASMNAEIGSK